MTTEMAVREDGAGLLERVLMTGDLSRLSAQDRLAYYRQVCESVGLNPLTRPFDYLTLNGKMVLYAKKDATDQLRKIHEVSITKLDREMTDGIYTVTADAKDATGRTDSSLGAVAIEGLKGEMKANAMMKAETKSKRRVTLSICGLGMLDETEIEAIPDAKRVRVTDDGEIIQAAINDNLFASASNEPPFAYEPPREVVIPATRTNVCPECDKPAIIKSKAEWGGGWVCYGKKGGCGAKFKDGDARIEGTAQAIQRHAHAAGVEGIPAVWTPNLARGIEVAGSVGGVTRPAPDAAPTTFDDEEVAARGPLLADLTRLATALKLTPAEKRTAVTTYLGKGVDVNYADVAALTDLVNFLRTRAGEPKYGEAA